MSKFLTGIASYFEGLKKENPFKNKLTVRADEEEEEEDLVDPQETIREDCTANHCEKFKVKLTSCNDRVNSRKKTEEVCLEEMIDLFHCVDHCASKTLFSKLK